MAEVFQCGFNRSCILNLNTNTHSSDRSGKFVHFETVFKHIDIEKKYFLRRLAIRDFTKYID